MSSNTLPQAEIIQQKNYIEQLKVLNKVFFDSHGHYPKYTIITFGCQMNENDSERMAGIMSDAGYLLTDNRNEADVIFFNTCSVRENAEKKVYGHIGALKKLKEENPSLIIGFTGCMAHQPEIVAFIKKTYRFVDLVFGNTSQYKIPELLLSVYENKTHIYNISNDETRIAEGMSFNRRYQTKAYVTVMYGCDNFCSYCIVPYVRGRERSREPQFITDEVKSLVDSGCKEIMLLGQNVNSYGKDLADQLDFSELLGMVNEIDGLQRIRFMTSHPKDLSASLIQQFQALDKLAYHIHIPVQSGSTKVLNEMNRKYTKEEYLNLVENIKKINPGIGLTTDIIVGFPGESEEDFIHTLDVVEKAEFDSAFTFIYSKRTGTPAAKREDHIPAEIINDRFNRLVRLQNDISKRKMDGLMGTVQSVLAEGESKDNKEYMTGRTSANRIVNFKGDHALTGKIVDVEISDVKTWSLLGELKAIHETGRKG